MKYVGSVLHYLIRDAFRANPPMIKDILALFNYYRNYHIYNEEIEKNHDIFNANILSLGDDDRNISKDLVPENSISAFFQTNPKWVDGIKRYISQWATNLGKFVRLRFARFDKNLEQKSLKRPVDTTLIPNINN
jgi:hypothetical protein